MKADRHHTGESACLCPICSKVNSKHGYGPTVTRLIYMVCMQWEANLVSVKVNKDIVGDLLEDLAKSFIDNAWNTLDALMERVRKRAMAAMDDPKNNKIGEIAILDCVTIVADEKRCCLCIVARDIEAKKTSPEYALVWGYLAAAHLQRLEICQRHHVWLKGAWEKEHAPRN